MCEDFEEPRIYASEGQQQDLDLQLDKRENKEVVQLARNPEDARVCHWHCT